MNGLKIKTNVNVAGLVTILEIGLLILSIEITKNKEDGHTNAQTELNMAQQ